MAGLFRVLVGMLLVLTAWQPNQSSAQTVRIGVSTDTTSVDPHFAQIGTNVVLAQHIFDTLVEFGPDLTMRPGLAESWRLTEDPHVWEFRLRHGVTFHDGSPFTSRDAMFSLRRAPDVPNAPSSYRRHLVDIADIAAPDDHTLRIRTRVPLPTLPNSVAPIAIVSHRIGERAEPGAFNTGQHAIGTGPYRFVEWVSGSHIRLAAAPAYWRGKPVWNEVVFRPIVNPGARVAALLAGDVDAINDVPPIDAPRLAREPRLALWRDLSSRVIFWMFDVHRAQTPHVTAKDGAPIDNPFRDARVRRAFSLAIDRDAIVRQVMDGLAVPASQVVPPMLPGHDPDLRMPAADLAAARRLMTEAGLADGFRLTLHVTANRYPNDLKQAQAVAQMLSRIGVEAKVASLPLAVYFNEARKHAFSFALVGWGFNSGDAHVVLRETFQTDALNNYGRWSNAEADSLLARTQVEMAPAARARAMAELQRVAIGDLAVIPTHFQINLWATRKGLRLIPRVDESTLADEIRPE
jgi:peptide/nickel transport system substrate-binding protein